mgnify:FL=1
MRKNSNAESLFCLDEISRTPIQIDNQFPAPHGRLYNHVPSQIIGPDFPLTADQSKNNENHREEDKDPETKRTSGVEPTLDPTKVLTALVANSNGQLPPYQL